MAAERRGDGEGPGKPDGPADAPLRCARCREALARTDLVVCWTCREPHHAACFEARGGCGRPGCRSRAALVPPLALARGNAPSPGPELSVAEPGLATLLTVVAAIFPAVLVGMTAAGSYGLPAALLVPVVLVLGMTLARFTVITRRVRLDPRGRRLLLGTWLGPLRLAPFRPWVGFEDVLELQLRRFEDPLAERLGRPVWDLWLVTRPGPGEAAPGRHLLARFDGVGEAGVRAQAGDWARRLGTALSLDPALAAAALPPAAALDPRAACPVCGEDLPPVERVYCARCGGPQHKACWTWNRGCAVYGCGHMAFTPVAPAGGEAGGLPAPGPASVATEQPVEVSPAAVTALAVGAWVAGAGGPGTLALWALLALAVVVARRELRDRFVFVDRRNGVAIQRWLGAVPLGRVRFLRHLPELARLFVLPEGEGPGARWGLAMLDTQGALVPLGSIPADDPEAARPQLEEVAARMGMVLLFHPPPGAWEALPEPLRARLARLPDPTAGEPEGGRGPASER